MMQVSSTVNIYQGVIDRTIDAAKTALEQTAEALHTEVVQAQVMPRDTGRLQNEATYVDYVESAAGKVAIISSTPYARRLYFHPEYNFSTVENSNAGGKWYDRWLPGGSDSDFCQKAFTEIYRRLV